jgi:hypothetical protein
MFDTWKLSNQQNFHIAQADKVSKDLPIDSACSASLTQNLMKK